MAPLRSLGNIFSAFDDFYARTGKDAVSSAPTNSSGITATGGTKTPIGAYTYHFITADSQNLAVSSVSGPGAIEFIIIGGGGGGGYSQNRDTRRGGGGGGAGGLITNWADHPYYPRCPSPAQNLTAVSYTHLTLPTILLV